MYKNIGIGTMTETERGTECRINTFGIENKSLLRTQSQKIIGIGQAKEVMRKVG